MIGFQFRLKRYIVNTFPGDSAIFRAGAAVNALVRRLRRSIGQQDYFQEQRYWETAISKLHPYVTEDANLKQMFPDALFPLISEFTGRKPRLLDIGSGPYSLLGYAAQHDLAAVDAIDPLANFYSSVMKRHGYKYPVHPRQGKGEDIATAFATNSFEVVYSSNALDHMTDPQKAFTMMADLTLLGGVIFIESYVDEGMHNQYTSLHRFDLNIVNNRLMCRDTDGRSIDLAAGLPLDVIHSEVQPSIKRGGGLPYFACDTKPWFSIAFRKTA